jgi:DNA polymerase-1
MFKIIEDIKPQYLAVAFDLKGPTKRKELYDGYKANRHGMPEELAEQMPIIKEVLNAMNIDIIEKQGYEGDDILGTLAKYGENQGLDVTILSGDRDTFQLASDNITIRIPRTKNGKTETENYDRAKVLEEYGLEPVQLIEVKALQGDTSDNIPGVPGIGPKTAISLIQKYGSVENLYSKIEKNEDDLKGKQKENIVNNKELAVLSKTLGTIDVNVPIEDTLENIKVEEWNKEKVLEIFKNLKFNRYIERFDLLKNTENVQTPQNENKFDILDITANSEEELKKLENKLLENKEIIYFLETAKDENAELIIKSKITGISIYIPNEEKVYYIRKGENFNGFLKNIFENNSIKKIGYSLTTDYILLRQINIEIQNLSYDVKVAGYILNSTEGKYKLEDLMQEYLGLYVNDYLTSQGVDDKKELQVSMFEVQEPQNEADKYKNAFFAYGIFKLKEKTQEKLKEIDAMELFEKIDMPTVEVLSDMQWNGMYVDVEELEKMGDSLKQTIKTLTEEIYDLAGEEFNINSPKQLGEVLFEKMELPVIKKTKSGYSTDVDVLEKLKNTHPVIEKILEYRQVMKLNSTYVEGLKPFINPKTKRIHSFFHQTITATGRISSTEPNLQNIPTRMELGKKIRKVFKPENGRKYVDADYSQIELRILAHMSEDEHMIEAFKNNEDIHKQAASKVLKIPIDEVTKEQRSSAKAVNFGIVYGISDFGLSEQLGISRKSAKQYIEDYLAEYSGIDKFMKNITEKAKETGKVSTLFNRVRYLPELSSSNYMIRQFGARAAMNTPIQGTAADIMKLAMIGVFKKLKEENLKSKIVLQVHDEMMLEVEPDETEKIKKIIKDSMESVIELKVPLIAEISEADNWYECK